LNERFFLGNQKWFFCGVNVKPLFKRGYCCVYCCLSHVECLYKVTGWTFTLEWKVLSSVFCLNSFFN